MTRGMHRAIARHLAEGRTLDLRKVSEPMRQRLIDMGMMEPPLVDVDGDHVRLTDAGRAWLSSPQQSGAK